MYETIIIMFKKNPNNFIKVMVAKYLKYFT